jgi:hypothetical protein
MANKGRLTAPTRGDSNLEKQPLCCTTRKVASATSLQHPTTIHPLASYSTACEPGPRSPQSLSTVWEAYLYPRSGTRPIVLHPVLTYDCTLGDTPSYTIVERLVAFLSALRSASLVNRGTLRPGSVPAITQTHQALSKPPWIPTLFGRSILLAADPRFSLCLI